MVAGQGTTGGTQREADKSSVNAHLNRSRRELRTQNTSGESNTEPTAAMLARSRKTSPILHMITEGEVHENGRPPAQKSMESGKRRTVREADRPLWGRPIFPVVLIISGYSFVSSIVAEIKSSNFQTAISDGGVNALQKQKRKVLTREIFTDCARAWDNDNFVLRGQLEWRSTLARQRNPSHVA